uniref:Easter-1 n=1 Tax=Nilaparvata lugens TaxID=108931 RepID=A0A068F756_NILLU|nr:easter-1 [Nilaparvata lugens]APA33890.1 seminal fluid protein [Nilaparvata lugens]
MRTQPALKIFGGENARLGEFPWIVLVIADKKDRSTGEFIGGSMCGGSIISEHHVLTAAHCFTDAVHEYYNIRLIVGEYDWSKDPDCDSDDFCAPSFIELPASKVSIHPDYQPHHPDKSYNPNSDIAVATVDPGFQFTDFVSPICLEYGELLGNKFAGEVAQVIGWGASALVDNKTQMPEILQKASLEVLDLESCRFSTEGKKSTDQEPAEQELMKPYLCAGAETQFSYAGDSGSPMFVAKSLNEDIPRQYQIGVFVQYFDANEVWKDGKRPHGYIRVGYYLEWILDQMS